MIYRGVKILEYWTLNGSGAVRVKFGGNHTGWFTVDHAQSAEEVIDRLWNNPHHTFMRVCANGTKASPDSSIDGIPWEIHRISDPVARAEATQAFQMNMLTSDDVRSSSEETTK